MLKRIYANGRYVFSVAVIFCCAASFLWIDAVNREIAEISHEMASYARENTEMDRVAREANRQLSLATQEANRQQSIMIANIGKQVDIISKKIESMSRSVFQAELGL